MNSSKDANELVYHEIVDMDSFDPKKLKTKDYSINSLLYFSLNKVNYKLAEWLCKLFIKSKDEDLSRLSIICLGYIAMTYRKLDLNKFIKDIVRIYYLSENNTLKSALNDACGDIKWYLKCKIMKKKRQFYEKN